MGIPLKMEQWSPVLLKDFQHICVPLLFPTGCCVSYALLLNCLVTNAKNYPIWMQTDNLYLLFHWSRPFPSHGLFISSSRSCLFPPLHPVPFLSFILSFFSHKSFPLHPIDPSTFLKMTRPLSYLDSAPSSFFLQPLSLLLNLSFHLINPFHFSFLILPVPFLLIMSLSSPWSAPFFSKIPSISPPWPGSFPLLDSAP
jgi:hypothetical protein